MSEELEVWIDPVERDGVASMATDEWLLRTAACVRIRCYRFEPGWGSFGYFVSDREASRLLGSRRRIRRWTGGGVVDHDIGWCYTLVAPAGTGLAAMGGAGSFQRIHGALARVLASAGFEVVSAPACAPTRGGDCFQQPVCFDLVGGDREKIAGAGQRRTRDGLLHQGAVRLAGPDLGAGLGSALSEHSRVVRLDPDRAELDAIAAERYARPGWNEGRRSAPRASRD